MDFIALDFESFWDTDYSLSKLPTAHYVRDVRFEAMSCSVLMPGENPTWFAGHHEDMRRWLQQFPFDDPMYITTAHNARFDGSILEWVFGIRPAKYFCTQFAANALVKPFTGSASLDAVGRYLGIGTVKGELKTKGKHLVDLSSGELKQLELYNNDDAIICYLAAELLYYDMMNRNPSGTEVAAIDLTVKKFTRPVLRLNKSVIQLALRQNKVEQDTLIKASGVPRANLSSNVLFAMELRKRGIDVPMKPSPTKANTLTYAFAKDDIGMVELLFDPETEALARGRLAAKSTLMQSRLTRLYHLAEQESVLPVPLVYYAAHTGRYGGSDFINLQNARRGSALRTAIEAPPGHDIVAADSSQIEARITAAVSNQVDLLADFASGIDVYCKFGTKLYGFEVTAEDHPDERFVAKTCVLQLGFGSGYKKLFHTIKYKYGAIYTLDGASLAVETYRDTYTKIVAVWRWLNTVAIPAMCSGREVMWGSVKFGKHHVLLPNGMRIEYPGLAYRTDEYSYMSYHGYEYGTNNLKPGHLVKLYGGKLLENIVQALARIYLVDCELRIARAGFPAALSVHDELVYAVPKHITNKLAKALELVMSKTIDWLPSCPVACKVKIAPNYGDAK